MAKYQLMAPAFIDGAYRETGAEIEFEGIPGPHMHPLDKAAEQALAGSREPRDSSETIVTGFYGYPGVREPPPPTDPPINIDVPYVDGVGAVGETLTCTMGNWEGATSYVYEWKRDGGEDIGVDDPAYVVVAADGGCEITCVVTAANDVGSTEAPPSNAVLVEAPARRGGKEKDK